MFYSRVHIWLYAALNCFKFYAALFSDRYTNNIKFNKEIIFFDQLFLNTHRLCADSLLKGVSMRKH